MVVLHIHQDFPDGRPYPTTNAVLNLLDASSKLMPEIEHRVLSINRTSNPFGVSFSEFDRGLSIVYWALPVNFIYATIMWCWAWYLVKRYNFSSVSLVHGHKLTTEGLLTRYMSQRLNVPYILSVRGGSDSHNLNRLRTIYKSFCKNLEQAKAVFWVSPWMKKRVKTEFEIDLEHKSANLPNICKIESLTFKAELRQNSAYFTVLSFHQYKRKGILPLLEAICELNRYGQTIKLDVFGGGSKEIESVIREKITELNLQSQILLKGKVEHAELLQQMSNYKGLLLPSKNETFGMAYIEALATGNTLMMHKDTGIDGFFADDTIGVAVENQSASTILAGINRLESQYEKYFAEVRQLQEESSLRTFTAESVASTYIEIINQIAGNKAMGLPEKEV